MTEAIDVLHAIDQLVSLASAEPHPDPEALSKVHAVLFRLGLHNGATGYRAEKLAAVSEGFESRYSARAGANDSDPSHLRTPLLREIEHLRKALARGSEGQD